MYILKVLAIYFWFWTAGYFACSLTMRRKEIIRLSTLIFDVLAAFIPLVFSQRDESRSF